MKLQVVGCNFRSARVDLLERLAFSREQCADALRSFRERNPGVEAVLLSTCNRTELYTLADPAVAAPSAAEATSFTLGCRGLADPEINGAFYHHQGVETVRHLFRVAASLDSMVVGETQILAQVKQSYELAVECETAGPRTHALFQAAIRSAKRVARETRLQQRRVSIPSVAVADFANAVFERFDNKQVLLIGAGEMGEETLVHLIGEGAKRIGIVNRSPERAALLAERLGGTPQPWEDLHDLIAQADLIVSTTGAEEPIVSREQFRAIVRRRFERPLFILDLALPRDFDPAVDEEAGVYLYSINDLRKACEANRAEREEFLPQAEAIVEEEAQRLLAEVHHRATAPTIRRLKQRAARLRDDELDRLISRLDGLDERAQAEIAQSFDRLVNKLLHPPLESLRDDAKRGASGGLLSALIELFRLKE